MGALGIDFGTSTTVAALCDRGELVPVRDAGGEVLTPSAIWFRPDGEVTYGRPALERSRVDPSNALCAVKRILGRPWHSREVLEFRNQYRSELTRGSDDHPRFVTRAGALSPVEVVARLLGHLRTFPALRDVEVSPVTVTVPVAARDDQRRATLEAASLAGFHELTWIEEPVAAALAYAEHRELPRRLAVYDLGGGTFDFALLESRGDELVVLSSGGDTYLGGDDVTYRLAHWAADRILEQHRWDVRSNADGFGQLVFACERVKIALSAQASYALPLADIDPNLERRSVSIERAHVESVSSDLVRRTFVICDDVMQRASLKVGDIDTVLLAGGGSYMPMVRQGVERYFGRRALAELPPDRVVALGAALHATRRS